MRVDDHEAQPGLDAKIQLVSDDRGNTNFGVICSYAGELESRYKDSAEDALREALNWLNMCWNTADRDIAAAEKRESESQRIHEQTEEALQAAWCQMKKQQ